MCASCCEVDSQKKKKNEVSFLKGEACRFLPADRNLIGRDLGLEPETEGEL